MNIKKISGIFVLATSLVLGSCIPENKEKSNIPFSLSNMMSFTVANGHQEISSGSALDIKYYVENYASESGEADFELSDFTDAYGYDFSTLTFTNLPWAYNPVTGWQDISVATARPNGQAISINNLYCSILGRYLTIDDRNVYYPCMDFRMQLNGDTYFFFPIGVVNTGETRVFNVGTSQEYVQPARDQSIYFVTFDVKKKLATLTIQGAKFDEKMPAMNMRFEDIPFTVDATGKAIFEKSEEIVPKIVNKVLDLSATGTPYPQFPITNLAGETDAANNMDLSFTCTITAERPSGTTVTEYRTTVKCVKPIASDQQQ